MTYENNTDHARALEWLRAHVGDLRSAAQVLRKSPWGAKLEATAAAIDEAADEGTLALASLSKKPEAVEMTKRELFTVAAMHTLRAGDYAKWEHLAHDAVSLADAILAALSQQPAACVGCEGKPTPENSPCAVCGQQPAAVDGDEVRRVAQHIGTAVDYIDKVYPDANMLDRDPIIRNMRRWHERLTAALASAPQQSAGVDEAMVERATTAYLHSRGTYEGEVPVDRDDIRAALTAALAGQQLATVDRARFRKAPCYLCGYNGAGYFQSETHPCAALYHAAQQQGGAE